MYKPDKYNHQRNTDAVRAKKHLGQHFLNDLNIAQQIADALPVAASDSVLEIGPGMGVLTQFLIKKDIKLFVIEIDRESVMYLKKNFDISVLTIIEGDFLNLQINALIKTPFSIIGNFPYNISSQILFKVLEYRNQVTSLVGMFQYEVARRISSGHGSKDYGILSVLIQTFYNTEYLFTVNENVFTPPPKVKSGVIRLTIKQEVELPFSEKHFFDVVKTAFNQRRKMLRNGLQKFSAHPNFNSMPFLDKRVEQLSVEQFFEMADRLKP